MAAVLFGFLPKGPLFSCPEWKPSSLHPQIAGKEANRRTTKTGRSGNSLVGVNSMPTSGFNSP
jgi:hypothetical protein